MDRKILLCCDLDRTVLPNGHATESPGARELFTQVTRYPGIILVYVSGRDKFLIERAIEQYQIPLPDYAIGDVGTSMYRIDAGNWLEMEGWTKHIATDWHNHTTHDLKQYLSGVGQIRLQEPEKQNRLKVSYYTPADVDVKEISRVITATLHEQDIAVNVIWSIDDLTHTGLLDVLPAKANKYHAIEFLANQCGIGKSDIVFAGDSGNDLPVILSDIPAVLVNNAREEIKQQARQSIENNRNAQNIYLARGGWCGLNGNYCAGVLEGLHHYHPELAKLFETG